MTQIRAAISTVASRGALLALLVQGLVACGGGGGKGAADAGPGGGDGDREGDGGTLPADDAGPVDETPPEVEPGGLALRVNKARHALILGYPEYNDLEVSLTLANGKGAPPASLLTGLFQVKTSAGLYVNGYAGAASWLDESTPACDPSISVGGDAAHTCTLKFELGEGQVPVELFYRTPNELAGMGDDRRSATAPFTVEACSPCGEDCTYLTHDKRHCGACDTSATFTTEYGQELQGRCVNGKPTCPEGDLPTACGTVCSNLTTSTVNCGACGQSVDNGTCVNGVPVCESAAVATTCGEDHCVDTTNDLEHCGGCGKSCMDKVEEGSPDCLAREGGAPRCEMDFYFSTENGDVLTPGDTCADLCVKKGFGGCSSCDQFETPIEEGESYRYCDCYWQP